jgi:predicted enzyme related to lactoylglutathione lyase
MQPRLGTSKEAVMTEHKVHPPGSFCWFELATNDPASAKDFYRQLFGWTSDELSGDPGRAHTIFRHQGRDVAALAALDVRQRAAGLPPHWLIYAAVANVDASAIEAQNLGGTLTTAPIDVAQAGRMAVITDPTGGRLALWEARKHIGAEVTNEQNSPCWFELQTHNVERARAFYGGLFGWSARVTTEPSQYTELVQHGISIGGMVEMDLRWGNVLPTWAMYFAVENCAETAKTAVAIGGKVIVPPTQIGKTMKFSMFSDPQGAPFSVLQM